MDVAPEIVENPEEEDVVDKIFDLLGKWNWMELNREEKNVKNLTIIFSGTIFHLENNVRTVFEITWMLFE